MISLFREIRDLIKELFGWELPKELVAIAALIISLYWLGQYQSSLQKQTMDGEWNIAVSTFQSIDLGILSSEQERLIGVQFFNRLQEDASKINGSSVLLEFRGPDDVESIIGLSDEERLIKAKEIADRINADILVYGTVYERGTVVFLQPEIFLRAKNSYEIEEMVGRHFFGSSIPIITSGTDIPAQIRLNSELTNRTILFSMIARGLSNFAYHDYERAYQMFASANSDELWVIDEGRELIYLLMGNAAGRASLLGEAEKAYSNALEISPNYNRALVGLAGIKYLRSLEYSSVENIDPDNKLLYESRELFKQALESTDELNGSDVLEKVSFGLGQINLVEWLSGANSLDSAIVAFNFVIDSYENGTNNRIFELAAEAHARLGLIDRQTGRFEDSISHFNQANKISTSPIRKGLYLKSLGDLYSHLGDEENAKEAYEEAIVQYEIESSNRPV